MDIEKIIMENKGLIYKVINKYKYYCDVDDLYQVGCIGLIYAYKNYNESFNTKFSSYAYLYILGEVNKYVRENRAIKVSKQHYSLYKKILETKGILMQRLRREPSNNEIAMFLEIDEDIINNVINIVSYVDSLDQIIDMDDKEISMYEKVCDKSSNIDIDSLLLKDSIMSLEDNERQLINKRYYMGKSQSEIAREKGCTQVQVSRTESKILKKLRSKIG